MPRRLEFAHFAPAWRAGPTARLAPAGSHHPMTVRTTGRENASRALSLTVTLLALFLAIAIHASSASAASTYTQVSTGSDHSCAVTTAGAVECWGSNYFGQLGDGTTKDRLAPKASLITTGATAVSAGLNATCAIVDGGAQCWGAGSSGQLGSGTTPNIGQPTLVTGMLTGVTSISMGGLQACAVVSGAAKCWGNGIVGNGSGYSISSTPMQVTGLSSGVQSISSGGNADACAIDVDSNVRCWGQNYNGQLGNGASGAPELTPVLVSNISSATTVDVGYDSVCAIASAGAVCWGSGANGKLGTADTSNSNVPAAVVGLDSGVTAIATGGNHACAIQSGAASCWGNNMRGTLTSPSGAFSALPILVSGVGSGAQLAVSAGADNSCVLVGGAISCWGNIGSGQLGNDESASSLVPTAAQSVTSGASKVAAGSNHSCAIASGAVKCWGANGLGSLGDGSGEDSQTPVQVDGLTSGATSVSAGGYMSCAAVSGAAYCWGYASYGGLGGGDSTPSYETPHQVSGLTSGVTSVTVGENNACAIVNGGAKCWGLGSSGQLGMIVAADSNVPVDVFGLGAGSGVTAISIGYNHTCAAVNGAAKCWGNNSAGALGTGDYVNSDTPINVPGLSSGVTDVSVGLRASCVVVSGAVECAGVGVTGQLGTGANISHNTFQQATSLDSGATQISISADSACAIGSFGTKCWGANPWGETGTGALSPAVPTPTAVTPALTGVAHIATGGHHTCAVVASAVKCWGRGNDGELGDGKAWTAMPQALDLTVDTAAPVVKFTSGHRYTTPTPAVAFTVSDDHATSTECKIDADSYAACVSPFTASSALALGGHTVTVKATDAADNVTELAFSINVANLAANVAIQSPASGQYLIADYGNKLYFTVDTSAETPLQVRCMVDGLYEYFCTSPFTAPMLADGHHQLTVRLLSPAPLYAFTEKSVDFIVDATAPPVTITSPTENMTITDPTATATFTVGDPDGDLATVKCSLDGAAPTTCVSPVITPTLAVGTHTFAVTATDTHGSARTVLVHFNKMNTIVNPTPPVQPPANGGGTGSGGSSSGDGSDSSEFGAAKPKFGKVPTSAGFTKTLTVKIDCEDFCFFMPVLKLGKKKVNLPDAKRPAGSTSGKVKFSKAIVKKIKAAIKKHEKVSVTITLMNKEEAFVTKTIKLK